VLTVIGGEGLVLEIDRRTTRLEPGAPFAFPGEAAVAARLTAGPIRDLNVMVRRGAWAATVSPWRGGHIVAADGVALLVMLLEDAEDFAALDGVLINAGETATLDLPVETRALVVALRTTSPILG
jgi:environmental stress-induced protein Ves